MLTPAGFNFIGTDKNMNTYLSKNLRDWVRVINATVVTQSDDHTCNLNECMCGHDCNSCECKSKEKTENIKSNLPFPETDPFDNPNDMITHTDTDSVYFFYTTEVIGIIAKWLYELDNINQFTKKPVHYRFINEIILKCIEYFNEKADGKSYFNYDKPYIDDKIQHIIFESDFKDYFTALNVSYFEAQSGVTVANRIDLEALKRNICNDINHKNNLFC